MLRFRDRVLRFRDLGASCFGLRFRVLRFRNYHRERSISLLTVLNDDHMNVKVGEELSTSVNATTFFPSC